METVFTTSYVDPDLDGVACAIAYAEFMHATGRSATACLLGHPTVEAEFALRTLEVPRPLERGPFTAEEKVILLDASEPLHFQGQLDVAQVVEVIDHRQVHEAQVFVNAKIQIELVGAAATLVAEKFFEQNVTPSREAALILQAAVISNTQNFQASTTTDRDHAMMAALGAVAALPSGFTHDMFAAKSDFTGPKLAQAMDTETGVFEISGKRIGIVQLELVGSDVLVENRHLEILAILEHLCEQNKLDFIFLTMLDIEEKLNRFICADPFMQTSLSSALNVTFTDNLAIRQGIIMRKQITPLLKSYLEKLSPSSG